jgi:hypothetical protein
MSMREIFIYEKHHDDARASQQQRFVDDHLAAARFYYIEIKHLPTPGV